MNKNNFYYYKYLKYKNKYLKKIQKGGVITDQGLLVDSEFIKQNKNLLNHALQIFGIDRVAAMIKNFNDTYVVNKPIISIGTGHGLLEAYTFKLHRVPFLAIEPTSNPLENTYMASEHFFWNPESNAGNVDEFLKSLKEDELANRSLLLNWCYPNEEYGNYDFNYIHALKPHSIFSISGGIKSQEINRDVRHLSNVLKFLFEKNIKYESLKQFTIEWLSINLIDLKKKKKNQDDLIQKYLTNELNFDKEIDFIPMVIKMLELFDKNKSSPHAEILKICYDIMFYLNKVLLHYINKFNKLFEKKKILPLEYSFTVMPDLEQKNFRSNAGGESFNKFLYEAITQKKGTFGSKYKVIKSLVSKFNFYVGGILANIYDISFDINILVNGDVLSASEAGEAVVDAEAGEAVVDAEAGEAVVDAEAGEAAVDAEGRKVIEIRNNVTIEYVLYIYLLLINNSLIDKINKIYKVISTSISEKEKIKFATNFKPYLEFLGKFYVIDHTNLDRSHRIREDRENIGFYLFELDSINYSNILDLV